MTIAAFLASLPRHMPTGAPSRRQWVGILKRAALVHPDRAAASRVFIRVLAGDGELKAEAYQAEESACALV